MSRARHAVDRDPELEAAHAHSAEHEDELRRSAVCGCFFCLKTFSPTAIFAWLQGPSPITVLCPRCGIDAVIGDASGYPVDDDAFLRRMRVYWFGAVNDAAQSLGA